MLSKWCSVTPLLSRDHFNCVTASTVRGLFSLLFPCLSFSTNAHSKSISSKVLHLYFLISWYQRVWCRKSLCCSIFHRDSPKPLWHFEMKWAEWDKLRDQGQQKYSRVIVLLFYKSAKSQHEKTHNGSQRFVLLNNRNVSFSSKTVHLTLQRYLKQVWLTFPLVHNNKVMNIKIHFLHIKISQFDRYSQDCINPLLWFCKWVLFSNIMLIMISKHMFIIDNVWIISN